MINCSKTVAAATIGASILACVMPLSAEPKRDANQPHRPSEQALSGFSLATEDDASYLRQLQEAASVACVRILDAHARGKIDDDATASALRAVDVLVTLRTKDRQSLQAICKNLAISNNTAQRILPLESYDVAYAVISLGGCPTIEAVLESLDKPLDKRSLLLRAHVLQRIDEREIILIHVRMAIRDAERKGSAATPATDTHLKNLKQVETWLKNPDVLNAVENWPSQN